MPYAYPGALAFFLFAFLAIEKTRARFVPWVASALMLVTTYVTFGAQQYSSPFTPTRLERIEFEPDDPDDTEEQPCTT